MGQHRRDGRRERRRDQDGPVSLQLIDVPELEALEFLLRGAGGYIVAERDDAFNDSASGISRVLILPKSAGPVRNQSTASFAPTVAFERAEPEPNRSSSFLLRRRCHLCLRRRR